MTSFQAPVPQRTNGLAIAGFVTSLLCISPVGIVLSAIALSQLKKDPAQQGRGLALAGLIIGIITLVLGILYWIFVIALVADSSNY